MKSFPGLLTLSAVLTLVGQGMAQAQDVALSFDLDAAPTPQSEPEPPEPVATEGVATEALTQPTPLPIPENGANPPTASDRGNQAIAPASSSAADRLPPPPASPYQTIAAQPKAVSLPQATVTEVALSFGESFGKQPAADALSQTVATRSSKASQPPPDVEAPPFNPFAGGTNSLVARIVGSAEGTRTPNGDRTAAYFGHQDPGNGVWNMGTFSYQHGAQTPEEADQKQLNRLQAQTQVLLQKAADKGIELTLEEKLNGIDLANQSPLAAIGRVGYIDRLAEARQMGLTGEEAIIHARTRSYINPDTNRWNAPGLGNTAEGITRDQTRRMRAISQAFEAYQQQHPEQLNIPVAGDRVARATTQSAAPALPSPAEDDVPLTLWEIDAPPPEASAPPADATSPAPAQSELAADLPTAAEPTSRVYEPFPKLTSSGPEVEPAAMTETTTAGPPAQSDWLQFSKAGGLEAEKPAAEAIDAVLSVDNPGAPL